MTIDLRPAVRVGGKRLIRTVSAVSARALRHVPLSRQQGATLEHCLRFAENLAAVYLCSSQETEPHVAVLHLNYRCNAACSFCSREDDIVSASKAKKRRWEHSDIEALLSSIRCLAPSLYIAGGEPTLDPLERTLETARRLRFYPVSVNTNAILLDLRPEVARLADVTVVSIHAATPAGLARTLRVRDQSAERALRNILILKRQSARYGNRCVANCVLTPDNLREAREVVDFCLGHKIPIAVVPAIVSYGPTLEGAGDDARRDYQALLDAVLLAKANDPHSVVPTFEYLRRIRDFRAYDCRPTSIVSVDPSGGVINPCAYRYSALPKVLGHVKDIASVAGAIDAEAGAERVFATCDKKCMKACNVEPAIALEDPALALLEIMATSLSSRFPRLSRFATGTEYRWQHRLDLSRPG